MTDQKNGKNLERNWEPEPERNRDWDAILLAVLACMVLVATIYVCWGMVEL
jgi:hypothetical protein